MLKDRAIEAHSSLAPLCSFEVGVLLAGVGIGGDNSVNHLTTFIRGL